MTLRFLPPDVLPKRKEYRYGGTYRPLGFASVPAGYTRVDPSIPGVPQTRFGVVIYSRPLTDGEARQFQLSPYVPKAELIEKMISSLGSKAAAYAEQPERVLDSALRSRFGRVMEQGNLHSDIPDQALLEEAVVEFKRRYNRANPKPPTLRAVARAVFQLEHAVDEPERLTPAVLRTLRAAGWREGDPVHDLRVDHDNRHFDAQAVVSDLSGPDFDLVSEMWR